MSDLVTHYGPTLCIVLKGYPRLSETFIAQEIRELERSGFSIQIVSLRHPYDSATHPIHDEIEADVLYLPEYLHQEPLRVLNAVFRCVFRLDIRAAVAQFARDFVRDPTRNRLRRFGQGCVMAIEASANARFYYAHFMHTPASVTQYASLLTSIPWAISAHAKDIWTIPDWEKREKMNKVEWLVTCTRSNFEHLNSLLNKNPLSQDSTQRDNTVNLVYHGVDLTRFTEPPVRSYEANGSSNKLQVTLLSVGRMVQKKGYSYLFQALAKLPPKLHWKFIHIGGGSLTDKLQDQARALGIDQSITWMGGQPQRVVLEALHKADLFVLPSIVGEDGDRDGLPNVLMEAQSQRLACLSTNISGIPELIDHGITGWLVNERDTDNLTDALITLITDTTLREKLANRGYEKLRTNFSHVTCMTRLQSLLETSMMNAV